MINISVGLFVIFGGIYFSNTSYWTSPDGFMPFGLSSVFRGSAKAYFAFVGYDAITITSEEAINPALSVPLALGFDIIFVTLLYFSVSASLTMMLPYNEINKDAAFAVVFNQKGWTWARYVVSTGAFVAMAGVLLTFLLTTPRCIYAMSADGILFKQLAKVNSKTQVPIYAIILDTDLTTCILAFLLNLDELVEFMSIGTLLAYLIVALALIVLRYSPRDVLGNQDAEINYIKHGKNEKVGF